MTNLAHDHSQVEAAAGVALVAAASLTADTVLPPPEAPAVIAPAPKPKPRPPSGASATLNHIRYVLGENPVTGFAFALFLLIVLAALFGPALVPYDPLASDTVAALQAAVARSIGSAPTSSAATSSAGSWSQRGSTSASRSPRSRWCS